MSGTPTTGLQVTQPHSVGTGERLSPTQVQPEWTAEQKAAWERREEAKKLWGGPNYLDAVGTPAQQEADRAAQRDAEEARLRERWPDPRQALRDAHARLRDAKGELQHRREVLARAADHLAATQAAHRESATVQAGVDAQAVARLKERIGTGANYALETTEEPVANGSEKAARDVELAETAHRELSDAVAEAERAEQRALRGIQEVAVACVLLRGIGVADEIAEAEQTLADRRRALWGIDRLWIDGKAVKLPGKIVAALAGRIMAAGPWEAAYKALLADADAPLP
jgi:hypothetical protein